MNILDFEQARHLTVRTGFGPEPHTISELIGLSREKAVAKLLSEPRNYLASQPIFQSFQKLRQVLKDDKINDTRLGGKLYRQDIRAIKNWAVDQALSNPNALEEKMSWFWHNHFTSSSERSGRSVNMLMTQSLLVRQHALGNFSTLLASISHDPLMLIYLDGINNRKEKPNENFARELLELFTLGEGHYTEKDIKEVARAFTGLKIDSITQKVVRNDTLFDSGKKKIFGKRRAFDSNGVLSLILKQPRTAEFIAEKMWYEFISIEPHVKATTHKWAEAFRESKYDITVLIEAVLLDDVFWDPKYRGRLIKSPLDVVIGTLRSLDLEDKELPLSILRVQLQRMGQDLYTPPNVKGWPGGIAWLDDLRLLVRQQFLRRLMRGNNNQPQPLTENNSSMMSKDESNTSGMSGMKQQSKNSLRVGSMPNIVSEQWEAWLLPISAASQARLAEPRDRLRAILLDPSYQLK